MSMQHSGTEDLSWEGHQTTLCPYASALFRLHSKTCRLVVEEEIWTGLHVPSFRCTFLDAVSSGQGWKAVPQVAMCRCAAPL